MAEPGTHSPQSMAAIRTSLGKIPNSRLVAIGTRPDAPDHEFQRLLDGGATYSQVHAARPDDPPFQRKDLGPRLSGPPVLARS